LLLNLVLHSIRENKTFSMSVFHRFTVILNLQLRMNEEAFSILMHTRKEWLFLLHFSELI
jgi:hypothetical protein